jgi:hypothetical protein
VAICWLDISRGVIHFIEDIGRELVLSRLSIASSRKFQKVIDLACNIDLRHRGLCDHSLYTWVYSINSYIETIKEVVKRKIQFSTYSILIS